MLIDLTQQGTRCSNGSGKAEKQLICGISAVEAEAELIHITLQTNTSAVVGSQQESLEIADCGMKPMQITSCVKVTAHFDIFQAAATAISVTLYFGLLRKELVYNLLQGFSFEVVYNFHPHKQGNPILRFGYCRYRLDFARTPATFSVMGRTADKVIIHLHNARKLVMFVSLPHSLTNPR